MLSVNNVGKRVVTSTGDLDILEAVSFSLDKGASLAITGASGSGKSTLLGILAGLDVPTEGDVALAGQSLTTLDEEGRATLRAQQVGFVFQSFQLLPGLTALENVMLPLELHDVPEPKTKAKRFLQRVGLEHRLQHYPQQLSGGEQQRVAIARAFASEPAILFADEPTGNLDSKTGAQIIDLLFDLNRELGTTLVLVTHEQRLADRCQHHVVMEGGRLLERASDSGSVRPEEISV